MTWRPPISDPTTSGTYDERERCAKCGKEIKFDPTGKDRFSCHCEEELSDIF